MSETERLMRACEQYVTQAERAYGDQAWEQAAGYASLAIERLHALAASGPPALADARLGLVDRLLDFIEQAKSRQARSVQIEGGVSDNGASLADSPWIVRAVPQVSDEDIIGMDSLKAELQLFVDKIQHPEVVARWKGARRGNRMILWGPPGTGKTFFARYVATKIQAAFYQVKASSLLSKWVGESQKNVVRLFDSVAQDDRAVIFMDEIDSVLGKRGSNSTVRDGVVTEFLQCMDGLTTSDRALFFIGATNRPFDLDEAAISRFGMMVYVPLPDFDVRLTYLRRLLSELADGHAEDVRAETLARDLEGHSMRDLLALKQNLADIGIRKNVQGRPAKVTAAEIEEALCKIAPPLSCQDTRRYEDLARTLSQSTSSS